MNPTIVTARRAALLDWYDAVGRSLPWRVRPEARAEGRRPDPYRVWLSEIMLQQTTVAAATPYYFKFLDRFPTLDALAAADLDDVLSLWAGLGYYARARNLHACAKAVAAQGGAFPASEAELLALPGVGAYTAAAIAAVCHDAPATVVDGNVERVIARLFAVEEPLPKAKATIRALAAELTDPDRPGDYAQAVMDLGATVCTPKSPACERCPWASVGWASVGGASAGGAVCAARARGDAESFPRKTKKAPRPTRHGVAFVLVRDGAVLLRRRPERGLLGGMAEPPGTPWREAPWSAADARRHAPVRVRWRAMGAVSHVFSHFALDLEVRRASAPVGFTPWEGWWAATDRLDAQALPSVMRKALTCGLAPGSG